MRHTTPFKLMTFVAAATLSLAALAADPTLHQVYQAAESGQLAQAQQMMEQVLRSHPNSAKAHYVDADILAKEGRVADARSELAKAEQLEPGLPFAKPAAVSELKAQLSGGNHLAPASLSTPASPASGHQMPWGMLLGAAAVLGALFMFFKARASQASNVYMPMNPSAAGGSTYYGPTPTPMQPSGGMGSGILGGLATGAAVGAGMVAGEALMHRVLGGSSDTSHDVLGAVDTTQLNRSAANDFDMGGADFGINDTSSWDDGGSASSSDDWS